MNDDIVERLREVADIKTGVLYSRRKILNDAADEITRLRQLLSAQVQDVAVKVKPLEWEEGNPGSYTEIAESPFGHYSVWEINGTGCWSPWKQGSGSIVDGGLAGAKAAAQADFEARIRSALSEQVQDVPDGWQLVPKEPTPKMLKAVWSLHHANGREIASVIYEALLAAAPKQEETK